MRIRGGTRYTYWIVFVVIYLGLGFLVPPGDGKPLGEFLRWLFFAGFVVFTWRCFRGAQETDEPRPLWRLTATSSYSYGVGYLFTLLSILPVIGFTVSLFASFGATNFRWNDGVWFELIQTVAQIVAMLLFYRSARRIRAAHLDPPVEPRDRALRAQTEAERRPGI
ncbi:hypothetical protein HQQ81_18355 [Microbacteriaceae bacterium VKM Ac-2854]|nr:hypothetical protein [Microbacteriaceae bacterium VKM Ac-2854]